MARASRSPRTHSRKELAPARAPVLLGFLVAGIAIALFAAVTRLLG